MILPSSRHDLVESPSARTRTDSLALCVIRAVDQLYPHLASRTPLTQVGTLFEFRSLLAIVLYCYAAGVFASEDIETAMREDRSFRCLCQDQFPGSAVIRDFRRHYRPSSEICLAAVLAAVEPGSPAMELARPRLPRPYQSCADRAAELVEQAMFIDLMTDETA